MNFTNEYQGSIDGLTNSVGTLLQEWVVPQIKQRIVTDLTNLNHALGGGFAPEVYGLVGRHYDARYSLLTHLVEYFACNGYQVIYLTDYDPA